MMIFIWFSMFLSTWWLTFTKNIWIYLVLMPIGEFNGSFGGVPTVLQASLADVIYDEQRTMAFGVLYGVAGLVVIVASIGTAIIEDIHGTEGVMIAYDISMMFTFLWLLFIYEETLTIDKRNKNKIKYERLSIIEKENDIKNNINCCIKKSKIIFEPLRPLLEMKKNKLLFWFGIIALFIGLPESGIDDLLASYCFQVLGLSGDNKKTTFTSEATISIGLSMLVSQLIFLPIVIKYIQNDVLRMTIALVAVVLFSVWGIALYIFPNYFFGYVFIYKCIFIIL